MLTIRKKLITASRVAAGIGLLLVGMIGAVSALHVLDSPKDGPSEQSTTAPRDIANDQPDRSASKSESSKKDTKKDSKSSDARVTVASSNNECDEDTYTPPTSQPTPATTRGSAHTTTTPSQQVKPSSEPQSEPTSDNSQTEKPQSEPSPPSDKEENTTTPLVSLNTPILSLHLGTR